METTLIYWGSMGIMPKNMETSICGRRVRPLKYMEIGFVVLLILTSNIPKSAPHESTQTDLAAVEYYRKCCAQGQAILWSGLGIIFALATERGNLYAYLWTLYSREVR